VPVQMPPSAKVTAHMLLRVEYAPGWVLSAWWADRIDRGADAAPADSTASHRDPMTHRSQKMRMDVTVSDITEGLVADAAR
jgi:hypothetical protein